MPGRSAVLTLPGLSTTSILVNLPQLMSLCKEPPVILVDRYDYERLRGRHLKDIGTNKKAPYLGMIYDELRRRGTLRLVDYSKYYTKETQQYYLQRNQDLLREIPEQAHRQIAVEGVENWVDYARGSYQEPFRAALGEDADSFAALRQKEEKLQQRMERGTGDHLNWNKKLLNKGVAALVIRDQMNQDLDLDVRYVVAGPEHELLGDLFGTTSQHSSEILETDYSFSDDADHISNLEPEKNIIGMNPQTITRTQEMFDDISRIAADAVDAGDSQWIHLGPSLALPQYNDLFDTEILQTQIQHELDASTLTAQTKQAIDQLGIETNNKGSAKIRREADWIAESYNISNGGDAGNMDLTGIINHSLDVSNYSFEIDQLLNQNDISQAAGFIAASILSDPIRRYDENDIYRRSMELVSRFDQTNLNDQELEVIEKERSGATWGEVNDWFETDSRER